MAINEPVQSITEKSLTDEQWAALRLHLVNGIGPRLYHLLVSRFGSASDVWAARETAWREVEGVGGKLVAALREARTSERAVEEWNRCRGAGIKLLFHDEDDYPQGLREIHDGPAVLYARGALEPRDRLAVAIVGARHCTLYGQQQAERLAGSLARAGFTIVSGLARGIDAAAHQGALTAQGRTLAVLATGVDRIYPPEHAELAIAIARNGAVLSEFPLDQAPTRGVFPQRNRLISGLSLGVIIVEASTTSGSLHTARHAMEQGREVFAVPGRIDSSASDGCHALLRDGATLVRHVDDVLEALGPLSQPVAASPTETVHSPRELTLNDQEKLVLNLVTADPQHTDEIVRGTQLDAAAVLRTLTILEMKRLIRRLPGGHLCRM